MRHLIPICLVFAACGAPATEDGPNDSFLSDGKADAFGVTEGSPEALGVLALVNGADYATLHDHAKVEKRAAKNIVAHRDGSDGIDGTADDNPFDTLKELDAIPYVGPAAFKKLLAYARAQGFVVDWQSDIPTGNFSSRTTVSMPGKQRYCQPTCIDRTYGIQLDLTISRGPDGAVALAFSYGDDWPAEPVNADGSFSREVSPTDANGESAISFQGHFEPGRVVVIDSFSYGTGGTVGMFASWSTTDTNTAPGRASF